MSIECLTTTTRPRRAVVGALACLTAFALTGCAGPRLDDHATDRLAFNFRQYFDGKLLAHGVVSDRGGKVLRRFVVTMQCEWAGDRATLDEQFAYDDGERQRRVWHVRALPDGRFVGMADDVVGEAVGAASGAAFNWHYTLKVPARGTVYELKFDDWMYRIDERTVLNKAAMSKFGVHVGDVFLSFNKL